MLRIRLLGQVAASGDVGDLALGGPKPKAVLAALALAHPRARTDDQLVDDVWGQEPPPSARNALQVNVTNLRRAISGIGSTIDRFGDGYRLGGNVHVDTQEFEALVARGRSALRTGEVGQACDALTSAVRMWGGPPLGGLAGAPFAEAPARYLDGLHATALVELAQACLRRGDADGSLTAALEVVEQVPYDERGARAVALAHYALGRQDLALAACREFRAVIADELGLDATRLLDDLEHSILTHTLGGVLGEDEAATDPAGTALPPRPPLVVGRTGAVTEIVNLLQDGVRVISLVGVGGIGKTTLATTVAHQLADSGVPVVVGELADETDLDLAAARLGHSLGVDGGDDPVRALAEGLGTRVLVLDNAEHLDGVARLVDLIATWSPRASVLITSRRPVGAASERVIRVAPLDSAEARQLFLAVAEPMRPGVGGSTPEAISRLCGLLDGIPLAITLAAGRIRTLTPQQLVDRIEDRRASVLEGSDAVTLPRRQASLAVVLEESTSALSPAARSTLEVLGSCGGTVSLELVEAVAGGPPADFVSGMDELVACGLVLAEPEGGFRVPGAVREFARGLGDRAALDEQVQREVAAMAAAESPRLFGAGAAGALARLGRDDQTLALVLAGACERGRAEVAATMTLSLNRYWLLSGRLVEGRDAVRRSRAVEGHDPVTSARLDVLEGTYDSYLNDAHAGTVLEPALRAAVEAGSAIDRVVVNGWCCLAAFRAHHGDLAGALSAVQEASVAAEASGDPALRSLARDIDGHVASYTGDHARSLGAALAGLVDARASGDQYDVVNLLVGAALDLIFLDRLDEALAFADDAYDLIADMEVGPLLGVLLLARGSALAAAGRDVAARENLLAALRVARERYPDSLACADILFMIGTTYAHAPQPRDSSVAARCLGAAETIYRDHDLPSDARVAATFLRARAEIVDAMGPERFAALSTLGARDPDRVIDLLLAQVSG